MVWTSDPLDQTPQQMPQVFLFLFWRLPLLYYLELTILNTKILHAYKKVLVNFLHNGLTYDDDFSNLL